jgi:ERF superfamily
MHRSSESIGAIAAALAKAQVELANPEKSLTGTLSAPPRRQELRTFRYAPLSSGLEIVRKCLGRHEIAAMQTTAIDDETGIIRLTTLLAHSSGEWVSSDWPVCPVTETAAPHRMGAALTYARRYALFTLVGIAGEDDVDAPDLEAPATEPSQGLDADRGSANGPKHSDGRGPPPVGSGREFKTISKPILSAEQSASRRDALLVEIERLNSAEDAAAWARDGLPVKNTLTTADAHEVERAFAARLSSFDKAEPDAGPGNVSIRTAGSDGLDAPRGPEVPPFAQPDSRPALQKGIRLRDKEHRRFVARQPCLVCGRSPSDPHHLRFAQPHALGRRVSDEFTVPLCRVHHRDLHHKGDEAAWWQAVKIDPLPLALKLWRQTRPSP